MNYQVTHNTWYSYSQPVGVCHNILRVRPREHTWQTCRKFELAITPTPKTRRDGMDFYGNHQTWISLEEPHSEFRVIATSEVSVAARPKPELAASTPWEKVHTLLTTSGEPTHIEARQFIFDSPHVPIAKELADYARPSFTPGRPLLEAVMDLTKRIHEEFKFVPGATSIETSALDALQLRCGVCQDFSHLEIGCLRSLGLSARYVSGYLATEPPPGQTRLAGADVSHAWISVFDPNTGWIDFDPTNGLIPSQQHVTLGWARDYNDVCPVRGITVGGENQWLGVSVDVIPVVSS